MSAQLLRKSVIQHFDRDTTNAAKGLLVLMVVLGHIREITFAAEDIFVFTNNFHVACFLMLPFLYTAKSFTTKFVKDQAARFLWPFFVFVTGTGLLYLVAIRGLGNADAWIFDYIQALIIGSSVKLDPVTGLQSFWFLPVIFTQSLIFTYIMNVKSLSWLPVIIGSFILHGLAAMVPFDWAYNIPLGLVLVGFSLFLGFSVRLILAYFSIELVKKLWPLYLVIFIGIQIFSLWSSHRIGYARFVLFGFDAWYLMIIFDVMLISALLLFLTNPPFKKCRILKICGVYSLQIYLFHHVIYNMLSKIGQKLSVITPIERAERSLFDQNGFHINAEQMHHLFEGFILLLLTLVLTAMCIWVTYKLKLLRVILFPKDWEELRSLGTKRA